MLQRIFEEFPAIFSYIKAQETPVYLVGGAVRDFLLSCPTHDLDFVVLGDAVQIARSTANQFHGAFYLLDAERNTARVLLDREHPTRMILDFAKARGDSLESDLMDRDFTINSIAFDVKHQRLNDPLGGAKDLHAHILRASSPDSFRNDPVRLMRAIRFCIYHNFRMEDQTRKWLRDSIPLLGIVSGERVRDELFRMLDGGKASTAIRLLQQTGMLAIILSELHLALSKAFSPDEQAQIWERVFIMLKKTDLILNLIEKKADETRENMHSGVFILHTSHLREDLRSHLSKEISASRTLRSFILFAGIFLSSAGFMNTGAQNSLDPDEVKKVFVACSKRLALSNAETQRGQIMLDNAHAITEIFQQEAPPQRSQIYHFFERCSDSGIDLSLLALAAIWASEGVGMSPQDWARRIDHSNTLLSAWWNHRHEYIDPPQIVTGDELIQTLGINEGPLIGILLSRIREAQAVGQIDQKSEALDLAREIILNGQGKICSNQGT